MWHPACTIGLSLSKLTIKLNKRVVMYTKIVRKRNRDNIKQRLEVI